MSHTLFLLRHAKSSWKKTGIPDHARPLNRRGRRAAPLIGAMMAQRGYFPELILCSSAQRTQETLRLILPCMTELPKCQIEDGLYDARNAETLLDRVQAIPNRHKSVLVIGHNPTLEDLALSLARTEDISQNGADMRAAMVEKFPTGALAVLRCLNASWSELVENSADLVDFVIPRSLE